MNWGKIKKDYVSDSSMSYRKLADKYGVSRTVIGDRAKKEGWRALRQEAAERAEAKLLENVGEENAKIDGKFCEAINLLLDRACGYIRAAKEWSPGAFKDMSAALKNIKDLKGIKSELDIEEQRARISALKAKYTPEDEGTECGVIIMPAVPEGGETDG